MTICFLLTHVPNPRMNKRIEILKKSAEVIVICTRRSSQNIWEPAQNVEHIIFDIDLPSAKHIVKRYMVSKGFEKKALEKLGEIKPDVIYAESLDTLMIAGKYKKAHDVRVIFEVADLRENYIVKPKKPVDRIITSMLLKKEKKAFKNVDRLVVTSPKFYDVHYYELISKDKMLFIPNAPDLTAFKSYIKKSTGDFTVGFIGGIRYLNQMKLLVDCAETCGCKVIFAGAAVTSNDYNDIKAYCEGKNFVEFTGRYDYDSEIASLYGRVDCVFAVYDADNPNVRIALPNKLYESVYCELPIIVAKGTYLEELVKEWGVGVSVSHKDPSDLAEALKKLKDDKAYYDRMVDCCKNSKKELDYESKVKQLNDDINRK